MTKKTGEIVYDQIGVSEAIRTIWTDIHINEPSDTHEKFSVDTRWKSPATFSQYERSGNVSFDVLKKAPSLPWACKYYGVIRKIRSSLVCGSCATLIRSYLFLTSSVVYKFAR